MNEFAVDLLMRLVRTTLLLSVAGAVLYLVVRFGRLHSARWRRYLAVLALLQGVIWVQAPLTVPWYEPIQEQANDVGPMRIEPPPIIAGGPFLPPAVTPSAPNIVEESAAVADPPPRAEPASTKRVSWPLLLCGLWGLGILGIIGVACWRYVAFVRSLPPARPIEPHWQNEFEDVRASMNVAGQLRFQVTDAIGPLLCWTPRSSLLIVPNDLWRGLTATQRRAVLRHELAHFKRRDLLTSLLVRALALPHWFNPLSWWAVGVFEESGEWICDDLAAVDGETQYAGILLRLCEPPSPAIWPTTAARGSGVAARVRRLLDTQTKEDSIMKKLILAAAAITLLVAGIVRVELVAQPRPEADAKIKRNVRNEELAAKQKAMIDAARSTYDLLVQDHILGIRGPNEVYVWSSYLRSSEVRAAESKQQAASACKEHLDRMKRLHAAVASLSNEGVKGGEADKLFAAQFYVAEADLLLLEAQNNQ